MSKHPQVLWAQRSSSSDASKNIVYLTVNLSDIDQNTLQYTLTPTSLSFKTNAGSGNLQSEYAFDLKFFGEVDPETSTRHLTSRSLVAVLRKKELKTEYWPRLTQEKSSFIKTDFSKWVDEDEQEEKPNLDEEEVGGIPGIGGGMDFSKLMGDGPSIQVNEGGEESDDEDGGPPPLEEPESSK